MLPLLQRALRTLYGACALAVFFMLVVTASVAALVVPRLEWRRSLTHRLARIALGILGLRVTATGLENLPEGSCVVAANHSSYVDGVVLTAILPPRFSFVIKREAADMPLAAKLHAAVARKLIETPGAWRLVPAPGLPTPAPTPVPAFSLVPSEA